MKKIFSLILFSLLPSLVLADKTAYVRTACANNGNGTSASCAGAPAGAGAYNTCALAIVGEVVANANIVTGGFGNLIINLAGTTADTTVCTINGFTTDATHLVRLTGDFAGGPYSTSLYRLTGAPNPSGGMLVISDQYVEAEKFQVYVTETGSGNTVGIFSDLGAGGLSLKVSNMLIRGAAGTGGAAGPGCIFWRPDVANAQGTFVNNVCYGFTGTGGNGMALWGSGYNAGEILIVYNNTVHGSLTGYSTHGGGTGDAQYFKNNIAQSNGTTGYNFDFGGAHTTNTTATNLSEDTSSPNNTWDSQVVTFVSETGGSEDLHLGSSDTAAKNQGTDLSADAIYPFSTDIDGATRSGTWDIGSDELPSTSSAVSVLNAMGEL